MNTAIASLLIIVSAATQQLPEWRSVIDALRLKHVDVPSSVLVATPNSAEAKAGIRNHLPRYVAFVMRKEEADFKTIIDLKRMMREIDDDPYEDAIWGIVSGPTAKDALRVASSVEPREIKTALGTTGYDMNIVPGEAAMFSDGYPEGSWAEKDAKGEVKHFQREGDLTSFFAQNWNRVDPNLLLTSSHASQYNLEMPFSRGNMVSTTNGFAMVPKQKLIDYATGQHIGCTNKVTVTPLNAPKNEKIWIAAGNCLIADNAPGENMVMTALGWGKVNQFVGYTATTWFGEIGWNTWYYFNVLRKPLNESYFIANQNLIFNLEYAVDNQRDFKPEVGKTADTYNNILFEFKKFKWQETGDSHAAPEKLAGRIWDRDATVLWGDPVQEYKLNTPCEVPPKWTEKSLPIGIIFPTTKPKRRVKGPKGFRLFIADDFALIVQWPDDLKPGWEKSLVFE